MAIFKGVGCKHVGFRGCSFCVHGLARVVWLSSLWHSASGSGGLACLQICQFGGGTLRHLALPIGAQPCVAMAFVALSNTWHSWDHLAHGGAYLRLWRGAQRHARSGMFNAYSTQLQHSSNACLVLQAYYSCYSGPKWLPRVHSKPRGGPGMSPGTWAWPGGALVAPVLMHVQACSSMFRHVQI